MFTYKNIMITYVIGGILSAGGEIGYRLKKGDSFKRSLLFGGIFFIISWIGVASLLSSIFGKD